MNFVVDAHNHTVASGHAYSTVEEYAAAAKKRGLSLIAITDHGPAMPNAADEFFFLNFSVIPREIRGVKIMMGVELNIMEKSGRVDLSERVLKTLSPVIASFHAPVYRFSDAELSREEKFAEITGAMMRVMENPLIDIIGHPGDPRFPFDIEKAVKKSLETGTLCEINNTSLDMSTGGGVSRAGSSETMYQMLEICKRESCPVVLGSDAHFSSYTGNFKQSAELLKKARFPLELVANTSAKNFLRLLKRNRNGGASA